MGVAVAVMGLVVFSISSIGAIVIKEALNQMYD